MKFILLILTFFFATNGYALDQEIGTKRSNSALPTTKVKIHNGMVSWSVYKSSYTDYVILSGLNEKDALNMLSIAEKAHVCTG